MLAAPEMATLQNASADSLSKGQAQRVALSSALLIRPDILMLDEALGGLDLPTLHHARDLIRANRQDGVFALVEVSHDPTRLIAPDAATFLLPEERIPHPNAAAPFPPRLAVLVGIGVWPIITALLYLIRPISQGWPVWLTTLALTPAMVVIMV